VHRAVFLCAATLAVGGCGGGPVTQDANEPEGEFEVDVLEASFPEQQRLAQDSELEIVVENVDTRTLPDVNVTVQGFDYKLRDPNNPTMIDPDVADPERPIFVVEKSPVEYLRESSSSNQSLVDREVGPPEGAGTVYVDNYSLGELEPGDKAKFRWAVSAVKAGPYELRYEVNAGLDGNARAVDVNGERPEGEFSGVIGQDAPDARVSSGDGETIVTDE